MELIESKSLLPTRREFAGRLFRQRKAFFVVFALVIAGFFLTGQFRPKYLAEMRVLVRKQRIDPVVTAVQASASDPQQLSVTEEEINSQVELLKADDLLKEVVLKTDLTHGHQNDPVAVAVAVNKLKKNLDVSAMPKTDLIAARYQGRSPEEARAVLANLASVFLARKRDTPGRDFQVAFFEQQVAQHLTALQAAEAKLSEFTRQTGVVSADLQRDLVVRQKSDTDQQRMQTDAAISEARAREVSLSMELLQAPPRIATETSARDNPELLQQLKTTLLNLQLKRQDLANKYDDHYRLVQDADREIAITQQMIAAQTQAPVKDESSNINPVRQTIEEELNRTRAELGGLEARAAQLSKSNVVLQRSAEQMAGHDIDQNELIRAVKTEGDQYQLYVDKLEQARMAAALDKNGILNVAVVQDPELPALRANPVPMVFGIMLFAGSILSFGAAFLVDVFDPTVRTTGELMDTLEMPALGGFGREIYLEGAQR